MKEILALPYRQMIRQHMNELAEDYLEKTGRRVCRSCGSDIQFMIITLKKIYNMTSFELKQTNAIFKMQQGSARTISNNVMSDELALEFLSIRKERIELFSKYPENWEELLENLPEEDEVTVDAVSEQSEEEVLREQLGEYKMTELREMYPDIKATSKADFIDKIINE